MVDVEKRPALGKNACRRMRAAGKIPANVYGLQMPSFSVAVESTRIREVLQLESGKNTVLTLTIGGGEQKRAVMIRELQRDPVTHRVVHVDFIRVDPTKPVVVQIPVRLEGVPEGVKNEGGILDFVHREVQVQCLPGDIPEHVDIDVSALHLNQHVSVRDIAVASNIQVLDDPEAIIGVVVASKAEVAAAEAAEEEAAAEEEEGAEAPKEGEGESAPADKES
jgi:large subunit ribosomal protein L25